MKQCSLTSQLKLKYQKKGLTKPFNNLLIGKQQQLIGTSFTGQQNLNSSTKQRVTTDQNPHYFIKLYEMNICICRKQKIKTMMCTRETERYTLVTKQTQSKSQQKTLKTQSNYFNWNNNQGKLFSSLNRCKYDDMKSRCNNISFMCVKIPMDQTYLSKQNQGGNKSFSSYMQGNSSQNFM
ncbi:Hypothetical_protein [Hexamita inflata]|uniref:Hypothetical_protein n=1 Tax=Hexamita inflata TaxID=28002 RepID=A0AA86UHY9_9EUKA|nr:Hypothetical protein HINF_LOCUS39527 [Hexamita inflata]